MYVFVDFFLCLMVAPFLFYTFDTGLKQGIGSGGNVFTILFLSYFRYDLVEIFFWPIMEVASLNVALYY